MCDPGTLPWSAARACPTPTHLIYHHIPEETHSDINLMQLSTGRICLHQHNGIFRSPRASVGENLCAISMPISMPQKHNLGVDIMSYYRLLDEFFSFLLLTNACPQNQNYMQQFLSTTAQGWSRHCQETKRAGGVFRAAKLFKTSNFNNLCGILGFARDSTPPQGTL